MVDLYNVPDDGAGDIGDQDNLRGSSTQINRLIIRGDVYFDEQRIKQYSGLCCISPYLAYFNDASCLRQLQSLSIC